MAVSALGGEKLRLERPLQYFGMCDASGAVAISSNLFVAASDEDNILRLYRADQAGLPLKEYDCNGFLELEGKSLEADLEAGARLGDRAFWIGSHGRNRIGKQRPNRCRFFATDIKVAGGEVTLTPVGKPCKTLLDDLISDPRLGPFHLEEAARYAPKELEALNIEGLAATPQGHLLIGFRNPVPRRKALLVPLLNPNEVIAGHRARFGPPMLLELGGLGIRDMAYHEGSYLIIAGSWHGGGPFRLYRWAGPGSEPIALTVKHLKDYQPEAIIIYPQKGLREVQILSDDGTRLIDGVPGKMVPDPRRQAFRSFWVVE
ncbi:MAG: DUF3616 domain-containing protein [Verrucomicrobiota bacterium]